MATTVITIPFFYSDHLYLYQYFPLKFVTARQRSHWKVMFSVLCIFQSVCLQVDVPGDHYPWCIAPHHIWPPKTRSNFLKLGPLTPGLVPLYRDSSPDSGSPGSDIWWARLAICSNLFTWGPHSWCWLLKPYIQLLNGPSYWKCFLRSSDWDWDIGFRLK